MARENRENGIDGKKKLEPCVEEKLNEIEILKQSLDEKKKEAEKYYDQLLRLGADFDNYRKRTDKDREGISKGSRAEMILKLLPVMDSFEKALSSLEKDEHNEKIIRGMELIYKQLNGILAMEGIERMECVGRQFDPHLHHAISTRKSGEHSEGEIIEESQCGYLLEGELLRPATVVVAAAEEKKEDDGKEKK